MHSPSTLTFTSDLDLDGRFDFCGIYIVMFMEILKTLLQVLLVFSILIIAFALTFYILFFQVVRYLHLCLVLISCVLSYVVLNRSKFKVTSARCCRW